jgi:hypothetical protein
MNNDPEIQSPGWRETWQMNDLIRLSIWMELECHNYQLNVKVKRFLFHNLTKIDASYNSVPTFLA